MKVLMLSNSEWDDNNSFGNTFSNFFDDCKNIQFANIFCREGIPNTKLCKRFLKITDKQLLRHILNKNCSPVQVAYNTTTSQEEDESGSKKSLWLLEFMRKKRWSIFFLLREVIWSLRDYKTIEFKRFIEEFAPDILFVPVYPYAYINKMALEIKSMYHLPMISYMSDDEYSLRQFSLSPLYWLRRIIQRNWVVKVLRSSSQVYVISEMQKRDCEKDLGITCKILTKSYDFTAKDTVKVSNIKKVSLLYAGNLGSGRWKSLAYISEVVEKLCKEGLQLEFNIYSATPLTRTMSKRLNRGCYCKVHAAVPYPVVQQLQEEADIVIHAESLSLRNGLEVRQSFSTKLVDLFFQSKCIFAIGRGDVASIYHLKSNDAAVVASSRKEVYNKLKKLVTNESVRQYYSKKAYGCGMKYHDRSKMKQMLMSDLEKLVD